VPKAKETCLNEYRNLALTSVAMKSFKRLVMAHINSILPDTLDPLQFVYRPNRSTDEDISVSLHTGLSHLDKRNTYVRMVFIDYSSAFNTIVSMKLITKLRSLTKHLPLQLDPGLPDGPHPGGKGRQQHICHTDPQHCGPSGVCT
jgi:hypothetical protein